MRRGGGEDKSATQTGLTARLSALESRMDQNEDPVILVQQSKLQLAAWTIAAIAAACGFYVGSLCIRDMAGKSNNG